MGELFILVLMGFVALAVVGVVAGLVSGSRGRSGHGRAAIWADGGPALGNDDPSGIGYSGGHGHHSGHHGHHGHHGHDHGGSGWGGFDGGGHHSGGFDAGGGGHHG